MLAPRRGASVALGLFFLLPAFSLAFSPLGTAPWGLLRANARSCSLTGRPLAARPMRSPAAPRMCAPVNAATLLEENPKALVESVRDGKLDLVNELIASGANVEAKDWKGRTGLHYAAEKGFVDVAKALLSAGAKLDPKTTEGLTPLHCATWMGEDPSIALAFIAAGADLEAQDLEGWTPLHTAASNYRTAMTQASPQPLPSICNKRPPPLSTDGIPPLSPPPSSPRHGCLGAIGAGANLDTFSLKICRCQTNMARIRQ